MQENITEFMSAHEEKLFVCQMHSSIPPYAKTGVVPLGTAP